jgi:hypothetical protein
MLHLLFSLALASPGYIPVQGSLSGPAGEALDGTRSVTFSLYASEGASTAAWTETSTVSLAEGAFAVSLGRINSLDLDFFATNDAPFLSITVDGVESPRVAIQTVPKAAYALKSGDAALLGGEGPAAYTYATGQGLTRTGNTFALDDARVTTLANSAIAASSSTLVSMLDPFFTTAAEATAAANAAIAGSTSTLISLLDPTFTTAAEATAAANAAIAGSTAALVAQLDPSFTTAAEATAAANTAIAGSESTIRGYLTDDFEAKYPNVEIGSVVGITDISRAGTAAADWADIPDMTVTVTVKETSHVLIEWDFTAYAPNGGWWATRLVVNGVGDQRAIHVQPIDYSDEDEHQHLFRIVELPAGTHTIKAQWGWGSQTVQSPGASGAQIWTRTLTALAIPTSSGSKIAYVEGLTDQCKAAGAYTAIPDMSVTLNATEPMAVLTEFDINLVGTGTFQWLGLRMARNGVPDATSMAIQPSGSGEDSAAHLFRVEEVPTGTHTWTAQWGDGAGSNGLCNPAGTTSTPVWTRRIGYLAIPTRVGARASYVDPLTNVTATGSWALINGTELAPFLPRAEPYVALTKAVVGFDPGANNAYAPLRLQVDNNPSVRGTHVQSSNSEDSFMGLHRVDVLQPGQHRIWAEWGTGNATPYSNAGVWTHRIGALSVPQRIHD